MSGPIVRKYGFPNFEKIFGERPLQHGQEEESDAAKTETSQEPASTARVEATKPGEESPKGAKA